MRRHRKLASAIIVVAAAIPGGCNQASQDRGFVQREWSMTLRELGIVPVFPPREDVVVGDVYVTDFDPEGKEARKIFETKWSKLTEAQRVQRLAMGLAPRLARLDAQNVTLDEYAKTLSAPATSPDYNSILGNPALAAANESVRQAESELQAAKDIVKRSEQAAGAAAKALRDAERARIDADTEVAQAEAALRDGRTKPADPQKIRQLEAALADRKREARDRETESIAAQRAFDDTPAEPKDAKAASERKNTEAKRRKADADRAVTLAEADLTAERSRTQDASQLETALATAKQKQSDRKSDEVKAARDNTDAAEALKTVKAETEPKIADAEKKVAALKAVRDNIEKAGARLLYAQPRDAVRNVYNATSNLSGTGGADDLLNSRVNRLRLVGFPEFATASFTQGDLSALIPIEAFSLGINISASQVQRVSVKVPAAESYGLSIKSLMSMIADQRTDVRGKSRSWRLKPELIEAAAFKYQTVAGPAKPTKNTVYFRVISEVYYARALDVSVFSSSSFGVRAQLAAPVPTATPKEGQPKQGSLESFQQPGIAAAGLESPAGAAALADLRARIGSTATVPGGQMQLVSYNEKSIGLRRVWDRPIAIGFRGLTIAVDLNTGVISEVRDASGGISTFLHTGTSPEPVQ